MQVVSIEEKNHVRMVRKIEQRRPKKNDKYSTSDDDDKSAPPSPTPGDIDQK